MSTAKTYAACSQLPPVSRAIRNTRLWFAAARPLDTMDNLSRLFRTRAEVLDAYGDDPEFSLLHVTKAQAKALMRRHNAAVQAYRDRQVCGSCGAPCEYSPCDECMDRLIENEMVRQWEEHCQRVEALPPYAEWVEALAALIRSWYEQEAGVIPFTNRACLRSLGPSGASVRI